MPRLLVALTYRRRCSAARQCLWPGALRNFEREPGKCEGDIRPCTRHVICHEPNQLAVLGMVRGGKFFTLQSLAQLLLEVQWDVDRSRLVHTEVGEDALGIRGLMKNDAIANSLKLNVQELRREAKIAGGKVLREISNDVIDEAIRAGKEDVFDVKEEKDSLTVSTKNKEIEIRLAADKTEVEKLGTDHTPPNTWSLLEAIEGPAESQNAPANT